MPALGLVVIGAAGLLVLLAWTLVFSRTLQAIRGYVPGLFTPLIDALIGADTAIYNALHGWADNAAGAVGQGLSSFYLGFGPLINGPLFFARASYAVLERIFNSEIPWILNTAQSWVAAALTNAEAYAQQAFASLAGAIVQIEQQFNALGQWASQQIGAAEAYAAGLFTSLGQYAQGLFMQAEADAGALVGQEAARAQGIESGIVQEIEQGLTQVEVDVQALTSSALAQASSWVQQLRSEVNGAFDYENRVIAGVEQGLDQEIANLKNSAPWLLLTAIENNGDLVARAAAEGMIAATVGEVESQIQQAEAIAARFRPIIQGVISGLGSLRS